MKNVPYWEKDSQQVPQELLAAWLCAFGRDVRGEPMTTPVREDKDADDEAA